MQKRRDKVLTQDLEIAAKHVPCIPAEDKITFAIGDIHGMYNHLEQLVQLCKSNVQFGQDFKFVFLGDYIDRGPESRKVIQYLIDFPYEKVCLKGNHEDMALDSYGTSMWMQNGGYQTAMEYKDDYDGSFSPDHKEFLKNLPLMHYDDHRIYVHAGLNPDQKALLHQKEEDLLWIRNHFLKSKVDFGRLVVHGHTPYDPKNGMQWGHNRNRLNLDTACVFGGSLTAAVFNDKVRDPTMFIQVGPNLTCSFKGVS